MRYLLLLVLLIGCTSTQSKHDVHRQEVGKIESVEIFPGSWKHPPQALVKCEHATVLLAYTAPIITGKPAYIVTDNRGFMWLTWDGSKFRYRISK